MTTHDLSLLTDEERAANYAASTCLIMCGLDDSAVKTLTQALIAARAENKRKDAVINRIMNGLENIHDIARRSLQSEKGGE